MSKFSEITKEMESLYTKKNTDYGNSFDKTLNEFGILPAVIRLSEKVDRLKAYCKNNAISVKDESIKDTLIDLANYAVMTRMWLDNDLSSNNSNSTI